jgi:replication initiation and membrane attachment protein
METIRDSWKAKRITTVDEAVKQILERADQRAQSVERAKSPKKESAAVRKNGKAVLQDKLPASVEWQREQEKSGQPAAKGKLISDDPELSKMLETLRKNQRGE